MNKTLILSCIFLLVLSSFAIAVDTGNLTETSENITLYFDNTGTFTKNYPGFFNVTWNATLGWAKINNGSTITTYNISSGESWALYQDPTTCVMPPYDNYYSNSNVYFCKGIFNFYGNVTNGVLRLDGANKNVTCFDTIFIGNNTKNSRGLTFNKQNITLINCTFINYTNPIIYAFGSDGSAVIGGSLKGNGSGVGISPTGRARNRINYTVIDNFAYGIQGGDNQYIENIKISNCSSYGIYQDGSSFTYINNVTAIGKDTTSSRGIVFFNSKNSTVVYSDISHYDEGIDLGTGTFNLTASFNRISSANLRGIITSNATNSIISNNNISDIVRNCIMFDGMQDNIYGNICTNFSHSCIDHHTGYGNDSIIHDNICKNSINSLNENMGCFYFNSGTHNLKAYNNLCENLSSINQTVLLHGFSIDDANSIYNNTNITFFNNTFKNIVSPNAYCAIIAGNNTLIEQNNFYDCGEKIRFVGYSGGASLYNTFKNNSYNSSTWLNVQYYDLNLNISGTNPILLNISANNNQNNTIKLNFSGEKEVILDLPNTLTSNSLIFNSLTPPYNDIRINGVVSALNQPNYSITLNPGDLVEVSDFTYCGDGIVQSPNDNSSFMEDCDGANLNSQTCLSVGFTKGTLSCNSCSFVTTDCQAKSQLCQDNLVPLSGMTTWLGLLVTIICIAFVFIIFTDNSINIKMEGNTFYTTVLIIISVGFLIGVGILILSNLC